MSPKETAQSTVNLLKGFFIDNHEKAKILKDGDSAKIWFETRAQVFQFVAEHIQKQIEWKLYE